MPTAAAPCRHAKVQKRHSDVSPRHGANIPGVTRIERLPEWVIDRIAAGEVVERPASVVKELLENSLDAGASSIRIALRNGGKTRIVVDDDGAGIPVGEAFLAVERHATSKLRAADDLEAIRTFGFRGEALSSIAAVSLFQLRTQVGTATGVEFNVRGGEFDSQRESAGTAGTRVQVDRLFFNVPARRKFLRSDATELAHVVRLVTRTALARHDVRFRLEHGNETLLDTPAAADAGQRLEQVFGRSRARKMLPFALESEGLHIHGFAGRPVDGLPRRDSQYVFVNGRIVADRMIGHAIGAAYEQTMPRGRYPALVLFVDIDPELVDVNVHPQKTEVRFRASQQVHETIRLAIRSALQHDAAVPALAELRPAGDADPGVPGGFGDAAPAYLQRHGGADPESNWTTNEPRRPASLIDGAGTALPLGQYRESYIVAQDRDGLLVVDQHAAHERILFEKYLADAEAGAVEVQTLMFPQTVELAPDEHAFLLAEFEEFARLGFRIDPFGGSAIRISAIPAVAAGSDPVALIRELLGQEARTARSAKRDTRELRRRLITTAACHAAIKVNYPLSRPAMQRLLDDLFRVENPTTCPHGRPALFRLGLDEIERAFRRR